ncbi:hypothetical protein SAMN05421854_110208 [Amycolatopsis rubida]|uniref:DUF8175 domain-containing protein n=2 Tax=Amycolatopsis rubida TaxID=112413 RepID=A0A1I5XFZ7_9PSEU|nr:hypothetical protein SAMN05421854_110208 [Amycolatopsis rubida]
MAARQRTRRRWWIVAIVAAIVATGLVGWLISSSSGAATAHPQQTAAPPARSAEGPPPSGQRPRCLTRWEAAPSGDPAPVSDCAGPRDASGGRARGFAHDRDGAVFAAINLTVRLSAASGAAVYRPTYAEQTVGDAQSALSQLAQEQSDAHAGDTRPTQWWWRISAGDPAGELVVVELAAATPQTAASKSFAHLSVTLQWVSGDWRVQLPRPRATAKSSVDGYASLGAVPGGGR